MPGRVSARTSTASRISHKSSSHNLKENETPNEGPVTSLRTQICSVFADTQKSTAGHRKLVVNLRKIQERCAYEPPQADDKKGSNDFNEEDFNAEVARCVLRILPIKKSESAGDRTIKFLGLFLKHASDKDMALFSQEEIERAEVMPETPSSRLTSHILGMLLPLLVAKEKTIRYRATEMIAHIINSLDSIDDDSYHLIRAGLLKRIRDKEATIRVQAVLGLGRLAGNEGDDEANGSPSEEDASGLLEKLLSVLQNDPSADVRRSLLLNLPLTPNTLPYLLERARDLDPATRRALYARLLPALGDFRHLSLSMREKLLRWGLRDRDENVRKATARLFRERWIGDCAGTSHSDAATKEAAPLTVDAILELLERIDVSNSGIEGGIAHEAMQEFWSGRADYLAQIQIEDSYWDGLTAERAFLVRSLNDFCREKKDGRYDAILDEKMPEVTKLAFFIQRYTNALIEQLRTLDPKLETEPEEATMESEFVIEQLLHVAATVDYSDEIGRRKMFALLRETLALPELPENITKLMIDVLRLICGNDAAAEREFCGVVLEAVAEVHDTITPDMPSELDADDSFHSAKSAQTESTANGANGSKKSRADGAEDDEDNAIREILVNLKCLHIAQCMLQNVGGALKANGHLVNMLNNLVVPAVRSHEAPIRERGLVCLGLCCLLDVTLAEENLTLFLHCFAKGHPALQATALEIVCDILTANPTLISNPKPGEAVDDSPLRKQILKMFNKGLKANHEPEVQAAATTSLCKLMLTRVLVDADVLCQLVVLFFEPGTQDNAATRQALSYFLPVFSRSRRENMRLLASVVPGVIHTVVGLGDELEEDEEMVGTTVVANLLADWTDPRKLVVLDGNSASVSWDELGRKQEKAVDGDVHLDVAEGLLEKALGSSCPKEERKALVTMLSKLFVTSNSDTEKLLSVRDLAIEATTSRVASETAARNALSKYLASIEKALSDQDASAGAERKGQGSKQTTVEPEALEETTLELDDAARPLGPAKAKSQLVEGDEDDDDTTMMIDRTGAPSVATTRESSAMPEESVMDSLLDESGVDL